MMIAISVSAATNYTFSAQNEAGVTIYYNVDSRNKFQCSVTSESYQSPSYTGVVSIPNTVYFEGDKYNEAGTYKVSSIGEYAFYNCNKLVAVFLPSTLEKIESCAFSGCTELSEINIPESVSEIGLAVFKNCKKLINVSIPKAVTILNNNVFEASGIKSIALHDGIVSIGGAAFSHCNNLENIEISESVCEIKSMAFSSCSNLKHIILPDSLKDLGDYAFQNCTKLEQINIPCKLTKIQKHVFYGCSSLNDVVIPNNIISIGDAAFAFCSSIKSVRIPNTITEINNSTFLNCTSLSMVIIPSSVTKIGARAFESLADSAHIHNYASSPQQISTGSVTKTFGKCKNLSIHVREEFVEDYKNANGWKSFNIVGDAKPILIEHIAFDESDYVCGVGQSHNIQVSIVPDSADIKELEWTSSDTDIVFVSNDGQFLAKAIGEAIITAKATDGSGVSAEVLVKVVDYSDISINKIDDTVIKIMNAYSIDGRVIRDNQKGLNLLKMNNGRMIKVLIK